MLRRNGYTAPAGLALLAALALACGGRLSAEEGKSGGEAPLANPILPNDGKKEEGKEKDAQDKKENDKKNEKDPKPPTHIVEKELFQIEVKVKGTFEAPAGATLSVPAKQWTMWQVEKAVEAGTKVKKGDELVVFDARKLDEAIADAEKGAKLADLAIQRLEEEIKLAEAGDPVELAAAERAQKVAEEERKAWKDTERGWRVKRANLSLESSQFWCESEEEELRQLEKMYKADDLTEETEEFILKRQRYYVKMSKAYFEREKEEHQLEMKVLILRQDEKVEEDLRRTTLALEKARTTQPLDRAKRAEDLAKMKYDRAKAAANLAELKQDRALMKLTAPADGFVFYGEATRGVFSESQMMEKMMRPGGMIKPFDVLVTVVPARPLKIRAAVQEADLQYVREGATGRAVPAGFADLKLDAKVAQVNPIALSPGTFDATFDVSINGDADVLMPGMACETRFVPYRKKDALAVPESVLRSEDAFGDDPSVEIYHEGQEPEKRKVKVGKRFGGKAEILEGLKEGDEVLLGKPDKKKNGKGDQGEKGGKDDAKAGAGGEKGKK